MPADSWRRRQAAALVKLLALAPRHRLHRDRAIGALWPDVTAEAVLPRLHKAAHFAREATACRDAVVLRDDLVLLFPAATVDVDVTAFEAAAAAAVSPEQCAAAARLYGGELLPDDLHEPWSDEPRQRLRRRLEHLLRAARDWQALLDLDPGDEQAHVELLRAAVAAGDRAAALRRYDMLEQALAKELGVEPGPDAVALRDRAVKQRTVADPAPVRPQPPRTETLVERDEELGSLARIARSVARTGSGCVVVVAGEAGSGKSSLTRAFLAQLGDGMTAAVGGCDDLLAPRSLGPFRDMAHDLPEVASALAGGGQPEDVLPALLRFVAARPMVLVLEDVHWADDATLDAIRYLSRRIATIPAILLLTLRDEEIDGSHPLRRVLGGLGSPVVRRIELGSLSVDGVRRLSGMVEAEATELHRVTRGNPFFVTEVLAAGSDAVPATIRDAVLARVGRLPAAVRRLTERLAVVPSRAERWLAEALADDDPGFVVAQAERSGVISGGPEFVSFRHELARRAVERSLTVGELVMANRAVLDILLTQPQVEPSRIVHHASRAVRVNTLLQYGPMAAADAERAGAHRQAAETLRLVLEHGDALDPVSRARLRTRRAYSLYVVNDYEAALAEIEAAVTAAQVCADPIVTADALVVRSRIVFFARGPATARRSAQQAVAILEGADDAKLAAAPIERARTHSNLATVGIVSQPTETSVRYAQRALDIVEGPGPDDLRAQALCYRGSGRLSLGDARGADDIEQCLAMGAQETRLEIRVRAYVNAAGSAYRWGRFADARRYISEGLRLAADGEFAAGEYRLHLTSAAISASAGEWDAAIAGLRQLLRGDGRAGLMVPLVRALLARLLARRGESAPARTVLAQAIADPMAPLDSYVAGPLAVA